jgi:hypothetical protein
MAECEKESAAYFFIAACVRVLNRIQMTSGFLLLSFFLFLPNESSIYRQTCDHCSFHVDTIQRIDHASVGQ